MKKIIVLLSMCLVLSFACFAVEFDGYIVKIKEDSASLLSSAVAEFSDAALFGELDDEGVVELLSEEFDDVSQISKKLKYVKAEDEESLEKLMELGIVEGYEEDILMELFEYDYSLNPVYSQLYYLDFINAKAAWDMGITGKGVKVGVIDSGVSEHSDIVDNLLKGRNYDINGDEEDTTDTFSHGTGVAGVIAAACNNISTLGIAFEAKIVPLKVTYKTSSGGTVVSTSYAMKALEDAVDVFDCDVVNMSFGTDTYNRYLEDAVNYAMNNGVIVVAATGNYGNRTYGGGSVVNPPLYPAYYDGVIGVANAAKSGTTLRIKDSSTYHEKVTIAAPGTDLMLLKNSTSGEKVDSGTSFSSPMVAAAAALVKSVKPDIGQAEFKSLLTSTADASYITASGQNSYKWGAGLLDIEAMLSELRCEVSKPEVVDGEICVFVNNLSPTISYENIAYIIEEYDESGKLIKSKADTFSVGTSTSYKISLTKLGFSDRAEVSINYEYCPLDADGNGRINVNDASAILRHIAGYTQKLSEKAADTDASDGGRITILDASAILRYLAGYPVKLE